MFCDSSNLIPHIFTLIFVFSDSVLLLCFLVCVSHQTTLVLWHRTAVWSLTFFWQICGCSQVLLWCLWSHTNEMMMSEAAGMLTITWVLPKNVYDLAVTGVFRWVSNIIDVQLNWAQLSSESFSWALNRDIISQHKPTNLQISKYIFSPCKLNIHYFKDSWAHMMVLIRFPLSCKTLSCLVDCLFNNICFLSRFAWHRNFIWTIPHDVLHHVIIY